MLKSHYTPTQVFSCEYCKIFKEHLFRRTCTNGCFSLDSILRNTYEIRVAWSHQLIKQQLNKGSGFITSSEHVFDEILKWNQVSSDANSSTGSGIYTKKQIRRTKCQY